MNEKNAKGRGGQDGGGGGGGKEIGGKASKTGESFHKLLPSLAEAMEMLDEGTIEDVQQKLEEITAVKYEKSELALGLENGILLGLFDARKEYKVNARHLKEELKTDKYDRKAIATYVRRRLKQDGVVCRTKSMSRVRGVVCNLCKRKMESNETKKRLKAPDSPKTNNNDRKSKLLVGRNPLETDPPYYDIFT